jgi:hypothetical protein
MITDLLFIQGQISGPTLASIEKATLFLQYCLKNHFHFLRAINHMWLTLGRVFITTNWQFQRSLVDTLACSLDCGISWISNALNSSSALNSSARGNLNAKWLLWPPAARFLFPETSSMDLAAEEMSILKDRLMAYLVWVLGSTEDRLNLISERFKVIIAGQEPGQRGIIGQAPSTDLYMAVPRALVDSTYQFQHRVWLLEKVDEKTWKLKDRTLVLGCHNLDLIGKLMQNQVVI